MLSIHCTLGLPLPLFPSIFPSRITLCMLLSLVRCPKYLHFLFLIDDKIVSVALANCKTLLFVLCSVHVIFSILLSIHISKACSFLLLFLLTSKFLNHKAMLTRRNIHKAFSWCQYLASLML